MSESIIGIHPIHRKLAELTYLNMDIKGNLVIGPAELRGILQLLRQNLEFIQTLDGLKALSFHAYELGDMDWQQDICKQIEELESVMEI